MKPSLPVNIGIELDHTEVSRSLPQPLPYDPRMESSMMIPTPPPVLAEVRVTLCIDETLAWLLPVQFSLGQLLTLEEVVAKLVEVFWLSGF